MLRAFLVITSCLVLFPTAAAAQPPGHPLPPPPMLMLLHQKSVQDELKITPQQFAKIRELMFREMQQARQLMATLPPEQYRQKIFDLFKGKEKNVLALLQSSQQKRFKEIKLQLRMPRAFTDAPVAAELKLDEDQQQQMSAIMDAATLDQKKLFESRPQPEVMLKKMAALKKKTLEQTLAVLTSEQRSKWTRMTGTPFTGQILLPLLPKGLPPPMPAPQPPAEKGFGLDNLLPGDLLFRETLNHQRQAARNNFLYDWQ